MGLLDFQMPGLDTPQGQGLLSAAFSLMQAKKMPGQKGAFAGALGDAGQQYLQTSNSATDQMMKRKYMDAQMQAQQMRLEAQRQKVMEAQKAEAERARIMGLIGNAGRVAPGMGAGLSGVDASALPPEFQTGASVPALQKSGQIDYQGLYQNGVPLEMLKGLSESSNLGRQKVKNIETVNVGGKPMKVGIDEYGQQVAQIGMEWRPLKTQDMGGYIGAFDETNPGAGVTRLGDKTQSPDSKASNALGWANNALTRRGQDMTNARAMDGTWAMNNDTGYMVNSRTGEYKLASGPDGRPMKNVKTTEGERTAGALLQRMRSSQMQLEDALKTKPDAATPGLIASGMRMFGADALANTVATSETRQQVEAAQLDILDAALTLGTGAAYTREQLEGYRRSYFPQIGDAPKTIADKEARLQNILKAAEVKAGGAVDKVPTVDQMRKDKPKDAPEVNAPPAAINWLRMNPKLRNEFDSKYGAGAAARVLGK